MANFVKPGDPCMETLNNQHLVRPPPTTPNPRPTRHTPIGLFLLHAPLNPPRPVLSPCGPATVAKNPDLRYVRALPKLSC